MNKTVRLADSLYNTPHLATPSVLDSVLHYLSDRNTNGADVEFSVLDQSKVSNRTPEYDKATKVGTLRIEGPLTYKPSIFSAVCGLQSYQQLEADFRTLLDLGAKKVLMIIDSGGGESYSSFETATTIRTLADKHNVKLLGYCDGIVGSAAYVFGSVCHELILNPMAQCGSIGCVLKLRNTSKAMEMQGIEDTYVYGGSEKIPFNAKGEWSDSFLSDIRSKVDVLYLQFVNFVADHRKLTTKSVSDTNARMFMANDAIKIGLADCAMTRSEFDKYLSTGIKPSSTKTIPSTASQGTAKTAANTKPVHMDGKEKSLQKTPATALKQSPKPTPVTLEYGSQAWRTARRNRVMTSFGYDAAHTILSRTFHLSDEAFEEAITNLERDLIGGAA